MISILISSEFLKMDTLVSVVKCDAGCGDARASCFSSVTGRTSVAIQNVQIKLWRCFFSMYDNNLIYVEQISLYAGKARGL